MGLHRRRCDALRASWSCALGVVRLARSAHFAYLWGGADQAAMRVRLARSRTGHGRERSRSNAQASRPVMGPAAATSSQPEMKGAAAAVLTPDRTDSPEPEVSGTRWSPRTSSADELDHVTDVGNFAPEASRARPISVT